MNSSRNDFTILDPPRMHRAQRGLPVGSPFFHNLRDKSIDLDFSFPRIQELQSCTYSHGSTPTGHVCGCDSVGAHHTELSYLQILACQDSISYRVALSQQTPRPLTAAASVTELLVCLHVLYVPHVHTLRHATLHDHDSTIPLPPSSSSFFLFRAHTLTHSPP